MNVTLEHQNTSDITNSTSVLTQSPALPLYGIVLLVLQCSIALCGVTWNILICVVIAKQPAKRANSFYLYICNLAVSDIGVLLVNFPLMSVRLLSKNWPLGELFCLYIFPATDIFFGASIWTISVIAIQRYRNIATQTRFRNRRGTRRQSLRRRKLRTALIIAGIWLASFSVMSLPVYFYINYNENFQVCYLNFTNVSLTQAYTVVLTLFCYCFPLCIIILTYVAISRQLQKAKVFHRQQILEHQGHKNSQGYRNSKKSRKILTPLVVIFAISMLPLNALRVVLCFFPQITSWGYYRLLLNICSLFTIINSALDPFVYTIVSKDFREGLKQLFTNCPLAQQVQNGPPHVLNESAVLSTRNSSHRTGFRTSP